MENTPKERLWTASYILVCIAGFAMSFSFFILVPTLPFYLQSTFGIGHTMIGFVLSCYVIAVLSVRPLAGFIADMFPRKRVYIIAYALFVLSFLGYFTITSTIAMFILLRIFHGFTFGTLSTTGNTLVIDVMPSSRRGEGLGYFGVMNNLAMAFGPMTGLFIIEHCDYTVLFTTSLATGTAGFIFASLVKVQRKAPAEHPVKGLSLDRFFLIEGIPACISLFMLSIPYGMTTSYMAMYAVESGITANSGLFFTVMAAGAVKVAADKTFKLTLQGSDTEDGPFADIPGAPEVTITGTTGTGTSFADGDILCKLVLPDTKRYVKIKVTSDTTSSGTVDVVLSYLAR